MKVSEITTTHIAEYLRLITGEYTVNELTVILTAAKSYIKAYTGLTDAQIDTHEDMVIAVYVLCQDMYDNRSMYVEKNNVNKVVDTILAMHCINLLPTPDEDEVVA